MLGKASISAVRTLVLLAQQNPQTCWSPRRLALALDESPTYLAKVVRHMVKAGILEAEKGAKGGVRLRRRPEEITLLAVVDACHQTMLWEFCTTTPGRQRRCNFHCAAIALQEAIAGVLGAWTIAKLLERPASPSVAGAVRCVMAGTGRNPLGGEQ